MALDLSELIEKLALMAERCTHVLVYRDSGCGDKLPPHIRIQGAESGVEDVMNSLNKLITELGGTPVI